ncbi:MAG: hypothetical protein ABDH23_07460, partial [Endomicrobiia bacterium]
YTNFSAIELDKIKANFIDDIFSIVDKINAEKEIMKMEISLSRKLTEEDSNVIDQVFDLITSLSLLNAGYMLYPNESFKIKEEYVLSKIKELVMKNDETREWIEMYRNKISDVIISIISKKMRRGRTILI